jgi:SAM-dependent methyltransferase
MNDFLENSFLLSTIYIGIVKNFFTDIFKNQPIGKYELSAINSYDIKYIEHWLNCAYSNNLILFSNEKKITLTEAGEKYVLGLQTDFEIVKVLRAIYNIIIVNKSLDMFDNKLKPHYSIIFDKEFAQIIPFYHIISQETHVNIAKNHIIANHNISSLFQISQNLKIIDYGCGSGWFIELLKAKYPNNHYIGIDDEKTVLNTQEYLYYEFISYNEDIPCFDVMFLNRVIHHLGEKRIPILESIIEKMNNNAHIIIWDFNWQKEKSKNFNEMAFLNLIEYIQGNTFIELNDIINELNRLGLQTQYFFINNFKDYILIAKR